MGGGKEEWAWSQENHLLSKGAWPPAQTLALPPGAALGPLSPCQGAPGGLSSPPRLGHQPSSAICLLPQPERSLQGMLEHECPPKNEQVLAVSSQGRGQRPGLGVLSTARPAPALPSQEQAIPWGTGAFIPSHLLSWQVPLAEGKPLPPQPQLRLQKEARPAEDRGRGQEGWRRLPSMLGEGSSDP